MDCGRQPPGETCGNLERATSAQLYDRPVKALVPLLLLIALAGCSRDQEADLPAACRSEPATFAAALASAPATVRVDGVRLSSCLAEDASVGDVQAVGVAFLGAAQQLGREGDPVGLGYLVGALRRGAEGGQGIHAELVRRIEQEAGPFSRRPGFERGLRAGRSSG